MTIPTYDFSGKVALVIGATGEWAEPSRSHWPAPAQW